MGFRQALDLLRRDPINRISHRNGSWYMGKGAGQALVADGEARGVIRTELPVSPYLGLPEENARCLLDLMVQHVVGSAFHEFCESLMHGLMAGGGRDLTADTSWLLQDDVTPSLGPAEIQLPGDATTADMAIPRVITVPYPGRPRILEDDWIYEQVDLLGRDAMEVYAEWLDLMPQERRKRLKDPLNSFRNALYLRRRKYGTNPALRLSSR